MARKRDYALEYERRRIRAVNRGFTSPNEQTKYNRAKKAAEAAGKKLTVYNFRKKHQAEIRRTAAKKTATRKAVKKQTKYQTLKMFGISENRLNIMRRENRAFSRKTKSPKLAYDLKIDNQTNNFSEERIGYITGYNQVFVHPKTKNVTGKNREKLVGRYLKLIEDYGLFADLSDLDYAYARERRVAA